ncbi:MAG: hypothetical protein WAU36_10610 [Cyclobacteriaceae bacterium]
MIRFLENQSIAKNPWTWITLVPILSFLIWGLYSILALPEESNPTHKTITVLLLFTILTCIGCLFLSMKTKVSDIGISISTYPFFISKSINWKDIKSAYITKYDKIYEFGHISYVGVAHGRSGYKAYFINGDTGVVVVTDQDKILIGTQKPKSLLNAISENINETSSI